MISHLTIKNFGPIRDIDVDCNDKDVFIVGPNGSGKTHILQAISLALTGKTSRNVTNDKLIGPNGSDFYIKLVLDSGDIIERTVKGASLTLADGQIYKKVADVYEHLPFDPVLLFNVCFIKQGKIAEFFESDNGKSVMSKMASLLIDVNRITEGYKALTTRINANKKSIDSLSGILAGMPENINEQVTAIEAEIVELEGKIPTTVVDVKTIEEQLAIHKSISSKNGQITVVDNQLKSIHVVNKPMSDLALLQENRRQYLILLAKQTEYNTEKEILDHFVEAKDKMPYIQKFFGIDVSLAKQQFDEQFLTAVSNNRKQVRTYMTTPEFTDESNALQLLEFWKKNGHIDSASIMAAKNAVQEVSGHLVPFKDVLQKLRGVGATPENVASLMDQLITNQQTKVNLIADEINKNKALPVSDDEIARVSEEHANYRNYVNNWKSLSTQLETLRSELSELTTKVLYNEQQLQNMASIANTKNAIMDAVNSKKSQITLLKDMEEKRSNYEKQYTETTQTVVSMEEWRDVLKDMPVRMRKALFHPVAYHLNKDFHDLFSFIGLGKIEIDWDNMDITIGDKQFEQLSGAQHIALGLSIRLALLKSMGQFVPVMLIDEPTEFMDDVRKNDVKLFLEYLSKYTQMFTCTHDNNIITIQDSLVINTAE